MTADYAIETVAAPSRERGEPSRSMIEVRHLVKVYDGQTAPAVSDLSFEAERGQLVTLLGPSGCGKTTTLRMLAGLETPTAGDIHLDGRCVFSSSDRVNVPAYSRKLGMVFQSYAIWPHMTVGDNVAFPLRVHRPRVRRREIDERVEQSLDMVGLAHLAKRSASALSGGQQQRVALARALVTEPSIVLLDEPLSNLDAQLRERMRDEIRAIQQRVGITMVYVTHDQAEALAISDDVLVMHDSRLVERGTPESIYRRPSSTFTASFIGTSNVLTGRVARDHNGRDGVETDAGFVPCHPPGSPGESVEIFLRPERLTLSAELGDPSSWEGTVSLSTFQGDCVEHHVEIGGVLVRVRSRGDVARMARGERVFVGVGDCDAAVFPVAAPERDTSDDAPPPEAGRKVVTHGA